MNNAAHDHLGEIEGTLTLEGRAIPICFEIYGHHVIGFASNETDQAELGGFVVDRIMLGDNDVADQLPAEAHEKITAYVNELITHRGADEDDRDDSDPD